MAAAKILAEVRSWLPCVGILARVQRHFTESATAYVGRIHKRNGGKRVGVDRIEGRRFRNRPGGMLPGRRQSLVALGVVDDRYATGAGP